MRIISLAVLVAAIFVSCAPPAVTAGSGRERNVITREEILASQASNAYDAVSRLRPNFLNSHGPTTIHGPDTGYPKVYLDHILLGDLSSLKTLNPVGIREIHYYNGPEASSRFGLDNVSGAIEVISATDR
jgi:hypothetical protein